MENTEIHCPECGQARVLDGGKYVRGPILCSRTRAGEAVYLCKSWHPGDNTHKFKIMAPAVTARAFTGDEASPCPKRSVTEVMVGDAERAKRQRSCGSVASRGSFIDLTYHFRYGGYAPHKRPERVLLLGFHHSSPALRSITVHRFQPRWGWLGMAGDDWGWLEMGGDRWGSRGQVSWHITQMSKSCNGM